MVIRETINEQSKESSISSMIREQMMMKRGIQRIATTRTTNQRDIDSIREFIAHLNCPENQDLVFQNNGNKSSVPYSEEPTEWEKESIPKLFKKIGCSPGQLNTVKNLYNGTTSEN